MSDLQISLLIIGIVVVLAVYGFGVWQQRQYRRGFNTAFKQRGSDALYQTSGQLEDLPETQALSSAAMDFTESDEDEVCATLDAASDYIAELALRSPVHGGALAPLWRRRFDFGKGVNICGLGAATGSWERVTAESRLSCTAFRVALQLVDRNGMISEAQLGSFRDLVREVAREVGADAILPDITEAAARAKHLDAFCAEVDQMIGLNILPSGNYLLSGKDIARVAAQHQLVLRADGAFHMLDAQGHTLFTMANFDNVPFQHDTLDQMEAVGLSLQMDVPRVEQPVRRFDTMVLLAHGIGGELRAAVVDDYRMALSAAGIAMIRDQVAVIEKRMMSYSIAAGSAKARRLFS
jgi:FtsZ-interacting cell division protein ZipA